MVRRYAYTLAPPARSATVLAFACALGCTTGDDGAMSTMVAQHPPWDASSTPPTVPGPAADSSTAGSVAQNAGRLPGGSTGARTLLDAGSFDASASDSPADEDASAATSKPAQPSAAAPRLAVGQTEALAAVSGQYGPVRSTEQLYGTDLGWMVRDHDRLWVLFGDSWTNPLVRTIDPAPNRDADDAIGVVSLLDFPDGASVEQFIREHPAPSEAFSWQATPPPIQFSVNPSSSVATPMLLVRDGSTLSSGGALTPLTGFSNERDDEAAGLFGIFFRNSAVQCTAGGCDDGRTCDHELGLCANGGQAPNDRSMPCVVGSAAYANCDTCVAVAGQGLCVDTGSSVYDASAARGRSGSVAVTHEVGNLLHDSDHVFATQPWNTHRFFTSTARTVRVFDAESPQNNDYRVLVAPADERAGVLLWGRPQLGGLHKRGRGVSVYMAWAPVPHYQEDGHFAWQPRYFAGLDGDGKPRFVEREMDSVPLDLDATVSGEQPEEIIDGCGHMTVAYVPTLQRWMMLYGSSIQEWYASLVYGEEIQFLDRSTLGTIYVRYATHPWGPWTPPEPFAEAGDPNALTGFFAPGSFLRSTSCTGAGCVQPDVTQPTEHGGLYSPHIIEPWLQPQADGVDVFWHVSNWNPYEVMLLKTPIRAQ